MASIKFTKKDNVDNKHVVQNTIYNWVHEKVKKVNSMLLLAGKHPMECVKRALPLMSKTGYVDLYEKDSSLYSFIRSNYRDQIKSLITNPQYIRLVNGDVKDAPYNIRFQDLDFCATFFADKHRAVRNVKYETDPINIMQERLFFQNREISFGWKTMIVSVSPRNGIGKVHTIECINSLCHLLGWDISRVDGLSRPHYDGYGKGKVVPGSGIVHKNGGLYHAYEHNIEVEKLPLSLDQVDNFNLRFFTYTDTQPMTTFALLYK